MCHIRELFQTMTDYSGLVLIGNNHACSIEGIGTVKIKMFDGVPRVLQKVCYIPSLCKNLILIGMLDALGYTSGVHGGVLDVLKGGKTILRGKRQESNLFVLRGLTL